MRIPNMTIRNTLSDVVIHPEGMASRFCLSLVAFLFFAFLSPVADAQVHTFVSALGNDANNCGRTAPCRTLAHAISVTNPGGEVLVLDSGVFEPIIIDKSLTVVAAPGIHAEIAVGDGDGVLVNAGDKDTVILRGLTIDAERIGVDGIRFLHGGALYVESCVVNGFLNTVAGRGLAFLSPGVLEVKDSIFRGNRVGIQVQSLLLERLAHATIDHTRLEGNAMVGCCPVGQGLLASDGSRVTVPESVASGFNVGFDAMSLIGIAVHLDMEKCAASKNEIGISGTAQQGASSVQINVARCLVSNNQAGIVVGADSTGSLQINAESSMFSDNDVYGIDLAPGAGQSATIRLSNSTVTGNIFGIAVAGPGLLLSRGNNTIEGNKFDGGPTGSYGPK
jgi:hypothetical protein